LIEIIGRVLDANVNSAKRKDERILITAEVIRKMSLLAKETAVFIQGVPRRCILRDLSFSGAKLIMMGVAKFLVNREAALRIDFDDPRESFLLRGSFIRAEDVEGRKELIALAVQFTDTIVPMGYKMRINDYLGQTRTELRPVVQETQSAEGTAVPDVTKPDAAAETPEEEIPAVPGLEPPPKI
jgi:hypothetical protein